MPTFIETPRFPDQISYGSSGGPGFKTFIFEGNTAIESRSQVWSRARGKWNIAKGVQDKADMDEVRAWFYNLAGRASGFRFKDWADYELVDEEIAEGDGVTVEFPIIKTYAVGNYTYVRRIFKPRGDGSYALIVKVNDTVKTLTTDYTIDYATGIITFTGVDNEDPTPDTGFFPGMGHAITVTGEFDVPARFDTDDLLPTHDGFELESWVNVPIIELMLEEPT